MDHFVGLSFFLMSIYVIFMPCSGQTCDSQYDFTGPADVTFIIDASESVNQNRFSDFKKFMKHMIRKTMLIGPDPDSDYVRLSVILFNASGVATAVNMISGQQQVYEMEFFSHQGIFEEKVKYDFSGQPHREPFKEAINKAGEIISSSLTAPNNTPRRQIVILATDAHFDNDQSGLKRDDAMSAVGNLRRTVLTYNGTLVMYGVGMGQYKNLTILQNIVDQAYRTSDNGNIISEDCRVHTLENWRDVFQMSNHPKKVNLGPDRNFVDRSLCCALCFTETIREGDPVPSRCSAKEFDSERTIISDLQCDNPKDFSDSCDNLVESTTVLMTMSTPNDDDDNGDDSYIMILFIIVNFVLIIMFILVAIFAPRIKQKERKSENLNITRSRRATNSYEHTTPGNVSPAPAVTPAPTRPAPKPPTHLVCPRPQLPNRIPPVPAFTSDGDPEQGNNSRDSDFSNTTSDWDGETNVAYEHEENTYSNVDISTEVTRRYQVNSQSQRPKTILEAFTEDYRKFKNRLSGRFESGDDQSVSQGSEISSRRRSMNPWKMFKRNRSERNYANSDTIQSIHDERARQQEIRVNSPSKTNTQVPDSGSGVESELERKLRERRLRSAQTQPDIVMDTEFANAATNRGNQSDSEGDDYENQDVINEMHAIQEQIYENA